MKYHLAQLNIASLKSALDTPLLADFVAKLDETNELAENHEGFIWRLIDDSESVIFNDPLLLTNMSVWKDVETLKKYTYKTAHANVMRQRKKWMNHINKAYYVLWWIPDGHIPTLKEAKERLELLQKKGATERAFDFKNIFEPPK